MDDSTTMRVVSAVAEATGRDVIDLPPLADSVDPDALETIVADAGNGHRVGVEVRFAYAGCDVAVEAGGEVTVGPAPPDPSRERSRND